MFEGNALRRGIQLVSVLISTLSTIAFPQARENLGPRINTPYDELLPVISSDGNTLYFDRKGTPYNIGGPKDDIWFSTRNPDGTWAIAENIGPPLNNADHNFVCAVLPDNNTLFLGNHYLTDGSMEMGISISTRNGGTWHIPRNLLIRDFHNLAPFSEFTLGPDGDVLIMSINPYNRRIPRDLYLSLLMRDGSWSAPMPLEDLNIFESDEITPFLAADGRTLYFSSNRPGGFGDYDVYVSRRLDAGWRHWSRPENLGRAVNGSGWDAYYTVPLVGEYAYFVSSTGGYGGTDIYRIRLPEEARATAVNIVKGKVLDPRKNPVYALVKYGRLADSTMMGRTLSDSLTGEYQVALPVGSSYGIYAEKEGYLSVPENIDLTNTTAYSEVWRDLTLLPKATGASVPLNNLFFDFNRAGLRPESEAELNRLVDVLESAPELQVRIEGHADSIGSSQYNKMLSIMRAYAVTQYLVAHNIPPSRIAFVGHGKEKPAASNDSENGRQRNRRVELVIL